VHRRQFVHPGPSIALVQLPPVSSTTAQSTESRNATTAQSSPASDTVLLPAGVAPLSTASQLLWNDFLARRRKLSLQNVITTAIGMAVGKPGVVYGLYSYQTSVRANELAAHAIELAMRESCRAHPVSHSILLCLVKLISNLYFSERRGSPKNRFMSSNASES
jgi:hypothetical protein